MFCDLFIKTKPQIWEDETCFAMRPAILMERYDDIFPPRNGLLKAFILGYF